MPNGGQQWGWQQWQAALVKAFFVDRDPSTPWTLFLDDAEARRLWPEVDQPTADLCACVDQYLDWHAGDRLFDRLDTRWQRWRRSRGDQPPPNLPVLAATVLAASAMHTDESATSAAYYVRLAELIRPSAAGADLLRIKDDLCHGFDVVAGWWDDLDTWVSARASTLGQSTIQTHETFWKVGYPISQALLRRSDRMLLTHFFAALDLNTEEIPPSSALTGLLSLWASRPRGFSETFTRALRAPGLQQVVGSLVHRQASAWDGVVLTPRGRRQLDLRIALDLDEFTATWAVPVVDEVPSVTLELGQHVVYLRQPQYGGLYETEGLPSLAGTLRQQRGLSLRGDGCEAVFRDQPILAFRGHQDAEWLSVDSVLPHERHILAVRPEYGPSMDSVLDTAARSGWRRLKQPPERALVPGRVVYLNVVLENEAAFREAVRGLSAGLVSALRPDPVARPRLVAGLRVAERLGSNHYLIGGAPDLLLPSADEERRVPAALDGRRQDPAFLATGFPIPLRRLPLEAGPHRLEVDGLELTFHLHDADTAGLSVSEARQLVWTVREDGTSPALSEGAPSTSSITGAAIPGMVPQPLLLRRHARDYSVVDQRGHVTPVTVAAPSAWLTRLGLPDPPYWEFSPPATAVWLVCVNSRTGAPERPIRVRWQDPHMAGLSGESSEVWRRIAHHWKGADRLLDVYISAWERSRRAG
ncbi:hypothetical protein SAMN05660642_02472 [Geodermatophilus siccatus]|uniref:Uncharacterized protein n=1 Tax=Geodermatophilus siccatus TaxID=1137991 RepID=A0A1G9T2V7_9ACTN|nr:hypothetical protein [Geodermatophilus siccatus]SDM42063.1 hypothetical protein SAMN05660642_02472 [Geodermatophilus siccatus]